MPTSKLPTSSISPIYNDASEIYITTPVKATFSPEIEKVQQHAVQVAHVLRQVAAKHQSNIGTDTTVLTRKSSALPCLLEQDCEDCDTSTTHKVTSTLHRTIDLDKLSCPQQLAKEFSADTIKAELHSLGLKCGGTISERAIRLWATKDISIISQLPQEMLASKQSEPKKKPQPKIVDNDDMTQWPTLQDWQVVRAC